jgi:ribosomal protein L5
MAKKTKAAAAVTAGPAGSPRMLDHYINTVRPALATEFKRTNPHAIPKLEKIVVNMGVGVAVTEKKYLEEALSAMAQVTGQKPIATLSKVAVSGFKLRENLPIGCKVTLRGRRMYEFLERHSTAMATTASGSPNRWSFPRSTPTNTPDHRA